MLSALPKLADRDFVLGFLLPALLAAAAASWAFPEASALAPLRSLNVTDKQLSDLAYLTVGVWLAAVLLMAANHTLYRMLEGYLPPFAWVGVLRARQLRRFRALRAQHDALMAEWETAENEDKRFPIAKRRELERLRLSLLARYPDDEVHVLPTAFGNVLRAFEVYSREVYGADAIPLWPRLAAVVPKDYAAQVSGARAQVDCFVNVAVLAAGLALAAIAVAVVNAADGPIASPDMVRCLVVVGVSVPVSLFAYRWALACAAMWGETVKAAFDCYLPVLAKQLGYDVPPTEAERRAFWEQFSARVLYRYPMAREWPLVGKADETAKPKEPLAPTAAGADRGDV